MSGLFRRRKASTETDTEESADADDTSFVDGSQTTYFTGDRQRDSDRIRLLIDSLRSLSTEVDSDELLALMVDRAVKIVGAERGLLFTADAKGEPVLRVGRSAGGSALPKGSTWSTQAVQSVLAGGESICKRDDEGGDFDPSQSMINLNIRAVMCVPLVFREERMGVIYVDARASERLFVRGDLRFFEAFADMLSIVWTNRQIMEERVRAERMKADLELAREIQSNLLPLHPVCDRGYTICGRVMPASEAGGDYFDFFPGKDQRLAVAVGDVSGHGAGPALFMSGARAYLRSYSGTTTSPREILRQLNAHLVSDMGDDQFISMFLCVLDPETHEFVYANAGHPASVLVRSADGALEDYKLTGMAVGVDDELDWDECGPNRLEPGDMLVMFSDGILELRKDNGDEEQYGRERLQESITRHCKGTAEELLAGIFTDALTWAGSEEPGQDDLTVAVLRRDS